MQDIIIQKFVRKMVDFLGANILYLKTPQESHRFVAKARVPNLSPGCSKQLLQHLGLVAWHLHTNIAAEVQDVESPRLKGPGTSHLPTLILSSKNITLFKNDEPSRASDAKKEKISPIHKKMGGWDFQMFQAMALAM